MQYRKLIKVMYLSSSLVWQLESLVGNDTVGYMVSQMKRGGLERNTE